MTSLIRGFDQSLRDSVKALGPSTIILTKLSIVSISSGAEFSDLLRRPNLTVDDAKAIEKLAPSIEIVDILLGDRPVADDRAHVLPRRADQAADRSSAPPSSSPRRRFAKVTLGRFFTEPEVLHRRRVVVLGDTAYQALFAQIGARPDRQEGADRRRRVHGRRRAGEGAVGGRLRQRSGRHGGDPADHAPGPVQHQRHAAAACRARTAPPS